MWLFRTSVSLLSLACCAGAASASETIAYTYDARGRLVQVQRTGTVNNGVGACYAYDEAGNRSNVTITTSGGSAGPSFSISNATATEGSPLIFIVTKGGCGSGAVGVGHETANGTATSGSDYTAATGTISFSASEATKTIAVLTTADSSIEGPETFYVNLSNASGGSTISDAQGIGTIGDNNASFALADASVSEGGSLVFTVIRAGSPATSFSVNYATAPGTAATNDYTGANGTLTFAPSETTKTVTVAKTEEAIFENAETLTLNLSGASSGATIVDAQGTGTIDNDDNPPSFSVGDVSVSEGLKLTFTVTKTGSTSLSSNVSYATAAGTATSGADYTASNGTLIFPSSTTSQTITVSTTHDYTIEPDETLYLNLSGATGGAIINDGQAVGTISNNDDGSGGGGGEQCYENGIPVPCDIYGTAPPTEVPATEDGGEAEALSVEPHTSSQENE